MKRWMVTAEVTISMHTMVEARTENEAREKAAESGMMHLCHQCAAGADRRDAWNEWRTSGEFDGEPNIVAVERAEP